MSGVTLFFISGFCVGAIVAVVGFVIFLIRTLGKSWRF